jgi:preprotein translocase subunit SecG
MIIVGLLTALFVFVCLLMIPLILLQKGKGSMGLGSMGGSAQMLFGGAGGQDLFQKMTWILGALFMGGSLLISIMKTHHYSSSRYLTKQQPIVQEAPVLPE